MTKPSLSPAQWPRTCRSLNPIVQGVRNPRLGARAAPAIHDVTAPATPKRPFHTTQPWSLRPLSKLPTTSHKANELSQAMILENKQGIPLDRDGFFRLRLKPEKLRHLDEDEFKRLYEAAAELLPPQVDLTTFTRVAERLVKAAGSIDCSAAAIQSISVDVDAVYRIGYVVARSSPGFQEYVQSACARAGSRRALVALVSRYLRLDGVDIHRNNEWITRLQELALKEDFPPAILVWAELLTWRGQTQEATEILEEKILPWMGLSPLPWRLYALANADDPEKVKDAMTRAALDFGEPIALTELAISALTSQPGGPEDAFADIDNEQAWQEYQKYEQYMTMAATAGYDPACFYIANWYYHISKGWLPNPEKRTRLLQERAWGISQPSDWDDPWKKYNPYMRMTQLLSHLNKPMEPDEYHLLSISWHQLAMLKKNNKSSPLILALLFRESGYFKDGLKMFHGALKTGFPDFLPRKGLLELDKNWFNPKYDPPMKQIAKKLMPIG
ncbi:uncharacterized protein N7511_001041 [Penicillium nucicola]|uniref:uncharacterized protein n=1 Tax=Penicillium nucicola TaxID=1850975 RepID=UPI002545B536|nr:uncharacterized protein N7511_001041 [Penicillium nucicola]KAJ5776030.1 hypothetical protein N7511_001041 [Penicillium nucicola]